MESANRFADEFSIPNRHASYEALVASIARLLGITPAPPTRLLTPHLAHPEPFDH